jgi:hypothetical protein
MHSIITERSLEHFQPVESLLSVSQPCHAKGAQPGARFCCTQLIGGAVRRVCPGFAEAAGAEKRHFVLRHQLATARRLRSRRGEQIGQTDSK